MPEKDMRHISEVVKTITDQVSYQRRVISSNEMPVFQRIPFWVMEVINRRWYQRYRTLSLPLSRRNGFSVREPTETLMPIQPTRFVKMHIQLRKIPYTTDQKRCFSVTITDRRKSHEKPIQHDLHVDALSAAAAEYQALRSYLLPYKVEEQERLINNELVTASVLMDVNKDGRIVPFDDYRLPGPIRVAFLVGAALLGCAVFWLSVVAWITLTGS